MRKRVLALVLAICLLLPVAMGCKEQKPSDAENSSTVASQESDTNDNSSKSSSENKKDDKDKDSSTNSTISYDVNFWRPGSPTNNDNNYDDDYDYDYDEGGDFEEETSSSTQSESVKISKDGVKIGMYHLSMKYCDSYGTSFEDREREFREVVEQDYFNTYFLSAQDFDSGFLMKEIEIIVEHGGTFWLAMWRYHSDNKLLGYKESLEAHEAALKRVIDAITAAGYRDSLLGMTWDEPIWNGQENKDFLTQSELYYKKFGLRTFPVFALDEFAKEGNFNADPVKFGSVATEALKYVTDVGYDVYDVDVRLEDQYRYGSQMNRYSAWAQALGTTVTSGRDYYIGYKELLKKRVGHDVNIWYFPTTFEWNTLNGKKADEEFCMAHLEFMAANLLKEKYQGGLALYTYYRHSTHKTVAFAQHCDIKNEKGEWARYPEFAKWTKYCDLLRKTRAKFDSIKAKTVDLGL